MLVTRAVIDVGYLPSKSKLLLTACLQPKVAETEAGSAVLYSRDLLPTSPPRGKKH